MVPWVRKTAQAKTTRKKKVKEQIPTNTDNTRQDGHVDMQQDENDHNLDIHAVAVPTPVPTEQTFHRYYHLYRRGELEDDIQTAGGIILDSGYEKDNWWAIFRRT